MTMKTPQERVEISPTQYLKMIEQELLNHTFGQLELSYGPNRQEFFFSTAVPSVPPPRTAAVIGASGDIGSTLTDYLVQNNVPRGRPPSAAGDDAFKKNSEAADNPLATASVDHGTPVTSTTIYKTRSGGTHNTSAAPRYTSRLSLK